jgi:hypothetical protein
MDFEAIANDRPMLVALFLVLVLGFFGGTQLGVSAELSEIEEGFRVQNDKIQITKQVTTTVAKK